MAYPEVLNVWYEQQYVGLLWQDSVDRIGFAYDAQWLRQSPFAISQSMPLGRQRFEPGEGIAHRWFANLLPEAGVRDRLARDLKLPDNDFVLLYAIGGECAGALSILPPDQSPDIENAYNPLDEEGLRRLILRRGQIPASTAFDERPRLSLAGAQDKCPIRIDGEQFLIPRRAAPSSHILKFEVSDYRNLPLYEAFLTRLAADIGLPTTNVELLSREQGQFIAIARYDRERRSDGGIRRLHQEDFCQALGYRHQQKYQAFGGPDFAACCRLVREISSDPLADVQNLIRWQIFNALAGNSDGHAKNLSLLHRPDGSVRLAPFYDLVCTRAIRRIDPRLAFDVGGERQPESIGTDHWKRMAKVCGVSPGFMTRLVRITAEALQSGLEPARKAFEAEYGQQPALQRVRKVVNTQCRRALKR